MSRYFARGIGIAALIVAGLLLIPFFPRMPEAGLDPSWHYALNEAVARNLVFGRDVIFTFGPLASLATATFDPATDTIMMIGSTVFAVGLAAGFALLAHPRRYALLILLPLVICLAYRPDSGFLALPFVLLLVVVRASLQPGSPMRLTPGPVVTFGTALTAFAVAMSPLVKGSFTGTALPLCGLAFIVLLLRHVRAAVGFAVLALSALLAAWYLTGQPLADLPRYFLAQGPIISGYTDAMSLEGSPWASLAYAAAGATLTMVFYLRFTRPNGWLGWMALLGLAWALFVAFKAGFVRQDGHVALSVGAMLLLACAVSCVSDWKVALPLWAIAGVASAYILSTALPIDSTYFGKQVAIAWARTVSGIQMRLGDAGVLSRTFNAANAAIRAKIPLPPVAGTVDVYPTELSAIFANGLSWSGRPVFQSYSAYDPRLDAKNVAHLSGTRAPDTVFFTFAPIDGRLPAFDDSGSLLSLLSGYKIVDYRAPFLQMTKLPRQARSPLDEAGARVVSGNLGDEIAVESTDPLWARLDLRPTLLGRIVSALYKLPLLHIVLTLDDGRIVEHRYIPAIGETGFILSPYMTSPEDVIRLAAGLTGTPRVTSFRITTWGTYLWPSRFEVRLVPIRLTPQPSARAAAMLGKSVE